MTKPIKSSQTLFRGADEIIIKASLEKKLAKNKPLKVKHGVDPTSAELHLGHAVIYEKLRQFQEQGHIIQFLIGGFTARFGDPTDQSSSRSLRGKQEIESISKGYIKQLKNILDINTIEVRSNAEWYDKMTAEGLIKLMSQSSVQRMLERDMFEKRMRLGQEVNLHEIIYPLLQGYDSVMLESDLTVIGCDQTFNELQARPLQEASGQAPQDLVIMPILVGTDGKRKMSQSYGNTINLQDEPNNMYGKIMSIPDSEIISYFSLVTRLPEKEVEEIKQALIKGENPRDAKAKLACEIVTIHHSKKAALKAEQEFKNVFSKHQTPSDTPELKLKKPSTVIDVLIEAKLVNSKSDARRMIEQGAVRVDGKTVKGINEKINKASGQVIQVGRRRFVKLVL
ncbi:MAG: tyrosine--tRNA ligase [bacterium]